LPRAAQGYELGLKLLAVLEFFLQAGGAKAVDRLGDLSRRCAGVR
jgi:hypothetical protein